MAEFDAILIHVHGSDKLHPRDVLVRNLINHAVHMPNPDITAPILKIKINACGSTMEFQGTKDIPFEDVPCPCGNPEHYMIRYKVTMPEPEPDLLHQLDPNIDRFFSDGTNE